MSATLIGLGIVSISVPTLLIAAGAAAKAFYKVPEADEAIVVTGGSKPTVSTGGGVLVIPLFRKMTRVSLQAIRIPIDRRGGEALPTADKLMAEIVGELFVQVNPASEADIMQAVQSIGTSNPTEMAAQVRDKIDSLVTDALRTAAFKKTFLELNSQKKEFADEVIDLLQEDLAKLGLTLTAVSIPHIYQGKFTSDSGDVFAAEGRRNVAATVEKNREETNRINREAQIKVMRQDVEAREQALALDLHKKQKEADQARAVAEYEAEQVAETRLQVLKHDKSTQTAEALQAREVETARITEERQIEEARIAKDRELEAARIAKQKAIETAEIERAESIKLADERRQQAIAEAMINKQIAIAARKEEEANARAKQADAESSQREAEERIVTVTAKALAAREREVAVIHADEDAQKRKIAADRDAYVQTKAAQAERDATLERAQGYANDVRVRAEADFEAADKQASARRKIAEALLEEGRSTAEARRLMVEAENAIARELLFRDVAVKALEVAPDVVRELMAPVANVAHDVKILQVQGLGGDGDGAEGLPATILNTGLAAAGVAPFLKDATRAALANDDVQQIASVVREVAKDAVKEAAKAITESAEGDSELPTAAK